MRLNYYDFLRGIAILMVVAIHTEPAYHFESMQGVLVIMVRQVLNCAVPIFFAISGYFLAMKKLETKKEIFSFWRHQIPKVYIPVLIWSLPYLFLFLRASKEPLLILIQYLICGYSVYYFIAVIIQYYLLLPVLQNIKRWRGVKPCILISVVSIVLVTYLLEIRGMSLPLVVYAGHGDLWLMFFVIGIVLRRSPLNCSLWWCVGLVILSFVWQMVEAYWLYSFNGGGLGIKPSSFLFSMSVILFLFHPLVVSRYSERKRCIRWIRGLGRISFGVYLIHCFFILILSRMGMGQLPWSLLWMVVVVASIMTIAIFKKLFPKFLNQYLGF